MPVMIQLGRELLRISPKDSKKLEYSTNDGRSWNTRFNGSFTTGLFTDICDMGHEL